MKKNCSKLLALLLTLVMIMGVFAGCGDTAEAPASETTEASATAPETPDTQAPEAGSAEEASVVEEIAAPEGFVNQTVELPIEADEVHYTCWMPVAPYVSTMMNLEDFSTQVAMVKAINEATNVYIDFNAIAGGTVEEEAFNLMIAGGDYMDIIGVMNYYSASRNSAGHEKAIEDGVIIDIKDLLEEYAPNYYNRLKENANAYMTMLTPSGMMGCIGQMLKVAGTENQGMIVRKDWFEASGVEALDTIDQFEEYLTFCKETYGAYAYLNYAGIDTNFGASFNTSGQFNVQDGKVYHSYTTQEFRDYLTKMNDWYKKGLFNDDFYNDTDLTTVRNDMANDLCSYVEGSAESMSNIFDMNPENTAMELMAIKYPKAEGVDEIHVGYEGSLLKNADTWAISTACGDPVPLMKLVNWLYSDEADLMYNWGEENVTYTLDGEGNPQWTDLVINNPDGLNFMFASYLYASGVGSVYFPGIYDMSKGFYSYNDDMLAAVETLSVLTDGAWNMPKYATLSTDETEEYVSYSTDLETYAEGMLLKFVLGDEPMENYDAFLDTCMEMGLDRMTELYQDAYDRGADMLANAG